jgi:hypothetical protein
MVHIHPEGGVAFLGEGKSCDASVFADIHSMSDADDNSFVGQ